LCITRIYAHVHVSILVCFHLMDDDDALMMV